MRPGIGKRGQMAVGVALVLAILTGCARSAPVNARSTAPAATGGPAATPTTTAAVPTSTPTRMPTKTLNQRIDAYIATLTPAQQIGQTLMMAVYANGYNASLNFALTQEHIGNAIVFPNYNGGPLMPTTLAGMQHSPPPFRRTPICHC